MRLKGLTGAATIGVILVSVVFVLAAFSFVVPVLGNTHTSSVDLQPEWSPADEDVNYEVEFCWESGDEINEVRIYQNYDGSADYTDFQCDDKAGWEKLYISTYPACFYVARNSADYLDEGNPCETFTFSAHSPEAGPEVCNLEWRFETRDISDYWTYLYDSTGVDDMAPEIKKDVLGPRLGPCPPEQGEECWVTYSTFINISVVEKGECGISGLDRCRITYTVDGSGPYLEVYNDTLNGASYWQYMMNFDEDSLHALNVTCYDVAGNMIEDIELFRVDDTPPVTNKNISEPKKILDGVEWVDSVTEITLTRVDPDPTQQNCNIGVDKTWYLNIIDESEEACWYPEVCQPIDIPSPYAEGTWCINNGQEWCENWKLLEYESWENCVENYAYKCGVDPRWKLYDGTPIQKPNESCHILQYFSIDHLGNIEGMNVNCFFVDKTPPMMIKEVGQPNVPCRDAECEEFDYWVRDNDTEILLDCDDSWLGEAPHPSGNEEVCYKISYDLDPFDLTREYCAPEDMENGWCCVPAPETIIFVEDSLHDLEYFCRDAVNKISKIDKEWFRVDSQPPIINKTMIGEEHLGDCPPTEGDVCYVRDDGENGVHITVKDDETYGCAVDDIHCRYVLKWQTSEEECLESGYSYGWGDDWCTVDVGNFIEQADVIFREDSTHLLRIECEDALHNYVKDEEFFLVDSTAPNTTKTYSPEGTWHEFKGVKWIDTATNITLNATDEKVGVNETYYRVSPADNSYCWYNCMYWQPSQPGMEGWNVYEGPFNNINESCHVIEYYSVDRFGNTERVNWQCIFVDKTAPIVSARTGEPSLPCEESEGCDYWIRDHETEVSLSCYDPEPHPSGVALIEYKWRLDGDPWTEWMEYDEPIVFEEDSVHDLEYRCTDNVGKMRVGPGKTYRVDSTAPIINKSIVGPQFGDCPPEEEGDECFIDGATSIEVNATDPDPTGFGCNVGDVTCSWRYSVNGDEPTDWNTTFPIRFPEECEHKLEIECCDALDNCKKTDTETFLVDHTPPTTTKTYGEPYFNNGSTEWITSETPINLSVEDTGPHKSGVKEVNWRVSIVDDMYCENQTLCHEESEYTGDKTFDSASPKLYGDYYEEVSFNIDKESCHLIEYYSVDNVDKEEPVNKQCVFVDNTPPEPVKTVGEPKTPWDGMDAVFYDLDDFCLAPGACWKITTMTPIALECVDPDPHPVNHNHVCFKAELDGDDYTGTYCEGWYGEMTDEGYCCIDTELPTFYFNEVSEHNLEYYCVDKLGNRGESDDEKFKVEETAFKIQINKKWNLISVPVSLLDDSMDEVFSGLEECVISVWSYDGSDWYVYTPDGDSSNDNLHTMRLGDGYWILAQDECMLTIGGSLMKPGQTPPDKDIVTGWNLIGYYGADGEEGYHGPVGNGKEAYEALCSLGASWWDKGFTSLMTYWEPDNPDLWKELNKWSNMDPGAGYWMFAPEEGIYAYSTACDWLFI